MQYLRPPMEVKELPSGATYLWIGCNADPAKDEAWLEKTAKEMLDTPDLFRRHILGDDNVVSGEPVYPMYDDKLHCSPKYHESGIPLIPQSVYFGGWDCGQTVNPAFVLLQVTPLPFQIHCLGEVVSGDAEYVAGESMEEFAPRVMHWMQRRLPGNWEQVQHFGDATVTARSGATKTTAQREAAKHGIAISPVSNAPGPRRSAVVWALNREIRAGVPGFLIDAIGAPTLRAGFQGHYKWKLKVSADQIGPGRVHLQPEKDFYSHVHEALQYPMLKIRQWLDPNGGRVLRDDDD